MAAGQHKTTSIRLPALLVRAEGRGRRWQGWPDLGDSLVIDRLSVDGVTEVEARRALTELAAAALRRACHRPVLVIGGGPDYADCVHLINPQPDGWVVYSIRDGRQTSSWHSDHDSDDLLKQVLDHVGGQPAVVTF